MRHVIVETSLLLYSEAAQCLRENGLNHTSYTDRSRIYLSQASEELAKADLCQASEKGWGAAAEMVKAVAEARGLEHNGHRQLYSVVSGLVAETSDEELMNRFAAAGQLHINFYEGWLDRASVELLLIQVARFVERMEGLLDAGAAAPRG